MNEYTVSAELWFCGHLTFIIQAQNRADALEKGKQYLAEIGRMGDVKPASLKVIKKNRKKGVK